MHTYIQDLLISIICKEKDPFLPLTHENEHNTRATLVSLLETLLEVHCVYYMYVYVSMYACMYMYMYVHVLPSSVY
jgi:hypothetical protein